MDVIRNADIARLVLGYLRDQNLEKAANAFCKSSPHLKDEYSLSKRGFRLVSLGSGQLVDIIREYCEIKSNVAQFTESLPYRVRNAIIKHNSLSRKISLLLEAAKKELTKEDSQCDENVSQKRRRSMEPFESSNLSTTQVQDLPGYSPSLRKRPRLSDSFLVLNNNKQNLNDSGEIDINDSLSISSSESGTVAISPSSRCTSPAESLHTPKRKIKPSIPIISETLLENQEFQNRLAENINKVLQNSAKKQSPVPNSSSAVGDENNDILNKQLDEMIKNIMQATEKDPSFDEIVEEVVYSTHNLKNPPRANRSTQVIPKGTSELVEIMPPSIPSAEGKTVEISTNQPESVIQSQTMSTTTSNNIQSPTPKIIFATIPSQNQATTLSESSKTASTASVVTTNSPQSVTSPNLTNNSLNISLLDPSFSISKFIMLNPDESLSTQLDNNNQIVTTPNINNIQNIATFGDQVVIDMNTGQLSIPISLANSMDIPLIISGDAVQEILEENCTSGQKQPTEPVSVVLEQRPIASLPPSSENIQPQITDVQTNQLKSVTNKLENQMPTSLDGRIKLYKATPSTSSLVPKIVRSLSTPRRKTSHVRVLDFTTPPKPVISDLNSKKINNGDGTENNITSVDGTKQNEIKPIEKEKIQPIESTAIVLTTENSNSNSNSLDFAVDKSNDTVIGRTFSETPKRKTKSKTCVRNLSRSNSLEDVQLKKKSTKLPKSRKKKILSSTKNVLKNTNSTKKEEEKEEDDSTAEENLNPMEKWQKMRTAVNMNNFDQHLRKIVSKTYIPAPRSSNKRRRRRIGNKTDFQQQQMQRESSQSQQQGEEMSAKKDASNNNNNENTEKENTNVEEGKSTDVKHIEKKTLPIRKLPKIRISPSTRNRKNAKIIKHSEKCQEKENGKNVEQLEKENKKIDVDSVNKNEQLKVIISLRGKDDTKTGEETIVGTIMPEVEKNKSTSTVIQTNLNNTIHTKEIQKRTGNIAHLLETPYKTSDLSACPITPRFLVPEQIDTPISKLMKSMENISAGKVFDVPTPNFAITPGAGLSSQEKEATPKSGHRSVHEYSSGSSYYRPDESEDLDKHLDKMLSNERKNRKAAIIVAEAAVTIEECTQKINSEKNINNETDKKLSRKESFESISEKKIPVPAVLERVKSFSDETPNCIPHYTLLEGLPENVNEMANSSSSSSSSSSCSTSSTSSASSVDARNPSLSDIDSSEDEDWKQQSSEIVIEQINENSLIAEDGEVRYPVRSWITPKKCEENPMQSSEPSGSKRSDGKPIDDDQTKRLHELEKKRLRMKEKLRVDLTVHDNNKQTIKINKKEKIVLKRKNAKLMNTSRRAAVKTIMPRLRRQQQVNIVSIKKISPPSKENSKDVPYKADNQVDMLKALNLSKRTVTELVRSKEVPKSILPFVETNDNAVMSHDDFKTCDVTPIDDFKDIDEDDQMRKAALALTAMQKKRVTKIIEPIPIKNLRPATKVRSQITKEPPVLLSKLRSGKDKKELERSSKTEIRKTTEKTFPNKIETSKSTTKKIERKKKVTTSAPTNISERNISNHTSSVELATMQPKVLLRKITPSPHTCRSRNHTPFSEHDENELNDLQQNQSTEVCSIVNEKPKEAVELLQNKENNLKQEKENQEKGVAIDDGDDEEEDEDPYDLCKLITIDENDHIRYKTYTYIGDNISNSCEKFLHNTSMPVMNIFLEGQPITLIVSKEIELFSQEDNQKIEKQLEKPIKNIPKKRDRKQHIEPSSSSGSCTSSSLKKIVKTISSKKMADSPPESLNRDLPKYTSTPSNPNFRVIYKERDLKKKCSDGGVRTTMAGRNPRSNELERSKHTETNDVNVEASQTLAVLSTVAAAGTTTTAAEAGAASAANSGNLDQHALLNLDDINAVLSHLHGDDYNEKMKSQ